MSSDHRTAASTADPGGEIAEFQALASSGTELARRLRDLRPPQYGRPSVCPGWSAADLANHVVGGEQRYVLLLRGADPAIVEATRGDDHIGDDPAGGFASRRRPLEEEFRRPGALDRIVNHRAGPRSGLELLRMRVLERALHAWDLARSLDVDDSLDPGLVDYLLDRCLSLVTALRAKGLYRAPAPVPDSEPAAPPVRRLLRLTGRDQT